MHQLKYVRPVSLVYIFLVIGIFFTHSTSYEWTERMTRPLALMSLAFLFYFNSSSFTLSFKRGIYIALSSFIVADVSFLFSYIDYDTFMIITFLFSLVGLYFYAYSMQFTPKKFISIWKFDDLSRVNLFFSILIIVFPVSIFMIENLKSWQYPSIFYQFILWLFIAHSLKRQNYVPTISYNLVVLGTFLYSLTTLLYTLLNFSPDFIQLGNLPILAIFASHYFLVLGLTTQE